MPVVLVSGLPRSGTSMMMKMLRAGGLPILTDKVRAADVDNPKGYYELEAVKGLDKSEDTSWLQKSSGRAVKVVSQLLRHLPDRHCYLVIFMERDLREIIASQNRMLDNRGEDLSEQEEDKLTKWFEDHLRRTKVWLRHQPNFNVLYVNYRDVILHPRREASRVGRFLGRRLDTVKMAEAVDSSLYRNRVEPFG